MMATGVLLGVFCAAPSRPDRLAAVQLDPAAFQPAQAYWNNFFQDALDDSDLDARDAQNRPIPVQKSNNELKSLFILTVFEALTDRSLPLIAAVRRTLERLINPASQQFNRLAEWLCHALACALPFALKRLADPGGWLWMGALFWALAAAGLLRSRFASLFVPSTDSIPRNLPLRC